MIGDGDPADLGVILGRHRDIHRGRDRAVAPDELGAILVKRDFVGIRLDRARLISGRPHVAAADIAQENI